MNKSTLLGIFLGIGLVAGAIYLETDDWMVFYNLAGILIVVGGTAAASFLSYPFSDVMSVRERSCRNQKFLLSGCNTDVG